MCNHLFPSFAAWSCLVTISMAKAPLLIVGTFLRQSHDRSSTRLSSTPASISTWSPEPGLSGPRRCSITKRPGFIDSSSWRPIRENHRCCWHWWELSKTVLGIFLVFLEAKLCWFFVAFGVKDTVGQYRSNLASDQLPISHEIHIFYVIYTCLLLSHWSEGSEWFWIARVIVRVTVRV